MGQQTDSSIGEMTAGDVLIVVDVQKDFCSNGALAVPDGEKVVPVINRLQDLFTTVIFSRDWHPPGPRNPRISYKRKPRAASPATGALARPASYWQWR